jgi:hypothetical protein
MIEIWAEVWVILAVTFTVLYLITMLVASPEKLIEMALAAQDNAALKPLHAHKIAQPRMNRTIGGTTRIGTQTFANLRTSTSADPKMP